MMEILLGILICGIEWSVDISGYLGEGFESLDFIMVEARDCSVGSCVSLDGAECAYFDR